MSVEWNSALTEISGIEARQNCLQTGTVVSDSVTDHREQEDLPIRIAMFSSRRDADHQPVSDFMDFTIRHPGPGRTGPLAVKFPAGVRPDFHNGCIHNSPVRQAVREQSTTDSALLPLILE